jgi:hypothetical protein
MRQIREELSVERRDCLESALAAVQPEAVQEIDTMTIPLTSPNPVAGTLLSRCPDCHTELAARLQLALKSIRAAAKRPVTPELLILCRQCRRQFVVSLNPALEGGR